MGVTNMFTTNVKTNASFHNPSSLFLGSPVNRKISTCSSIARFLAESFPKCGLFSHLFLINLLVARFDLESRGGNGNHRVEQFYQRKCCLSMHQKSYPYNYTRLCPHRYLFIEIKSISLCVYVNSARDIVTSRS